MDVSAAVDVLRQGQSPAFPAEAKKQGFAEKLDEQDQLRHLRKQFNIPTKSSLRKKALDCT
jgi:kynureninase